MQPFLDRRGPAGQSPSDGPGWTVEESSRSVSRGLPRRTHHRAGRTGPGRERCVGPGRRVLGPHRLTLVADLRAHGHLAPRRDRPRDDAQAVLLQDGRVLVMGGEDHSGPMAEAELYDPATGIWSPTGSMIEPRHEFTATLLPDGRVLVAGGYDIATAEVYDPSTGTWAPTGSMSVSRGLASAVHLSDG